MQRVHFSLPASLLSVFLVAVGLSASASATAVVLAPPTAAEHFVAVCHTRLALTDEQRTSLRTYLEQEINYMAVQTANHSATEVAELIPAERAQLQQVAGKLLSTGQLRQFRELEATPKMRAYLRQMSLGE
ncbi:hypothetical protein E4631_12750 [Hymenobacter sp. UV11]|uniref:hypothetical protein n=1 Tax=Hymenobacter sp. UV11 TaxID=1849735 RepID=UPI001076AD4C|nr:hypothetical protein [Hymenobacter sp. UV11]TDN38954.1 hypothetical protein A8B98_20855 [Hymenobacter sp. UV11]TFZ65962.1 hypothetical protein E4631_12750 [Hymenobacter sp. UV11]